MIEHICRSCGKTKAPEEMAARGGVIGTQCRDCYGKALSAGHAKKRGGGSTLKTSTAPLAPTKSDANGTQRKRISKRTQKFKLDLPSAFGFRAQIAASGDRLMLEQDDAEGNTDEILLSRAEAKQLFEGFAAWARG